MKSLPETHAQGLLENIVDTMNDGLFVVSPDGTIRMVNNALCRMLGYQRHELEGQPCNVLDCDECETSRSEGGGHWCRLFDTGQENRKPCLVARKDGSYLRVLKNASLLSEEGRVVGSVETLTDVSDLGRQEQAIAGLERLLEPENGFHGLIGSSPIMERTYRLLEKAAQSDAPVILFGESGTGKELAAWAIHRLGRRSEGPFIPCHCAALNESLLESELFGHIKGAFTGAYRHRLGRFEAAHGGDLFLDEIGDIAPDIQVKLLRVLETRRFERVGDHRPIEADVRIISATNRDLASLVSQGRFREDLFFRINVIPITMPPLRQRREDIPHLVGHLLKRLRADSGKELNGLTPEAMARLVAHDWPGNVRELKSALEYAFVISDSGLIDTEHLPPRIAAEPLCPPTEALGHQPVGPLPRPGQAQERQALLEALARSGGNKSQAARLLGVSRLTVLNRMRKYGIDTRTVIST